MSLLVLNLFFLLLFPSIIRRKLFLLFLLWFAFSLSLLSLSLFFLSLPSLFFICCGFCEPLGIQFVLSSPVPFDNKKKLFLLFLQWLIFFFFFFLSLSLLFLFNFSLSLLSLSLHFLSIFFFFFFFSLVSPSILCCFLVFKLCFLKDSSSFFHDFAVGASAEVAGMAVLLSAYDALVASDSLSSLPSQVFFFFFFFVVVVVVVVVCCCWGRRRMKGINFFFFFATKIVDVWILQWRSVWILRVQKIC